MPDAAMLTTDGATSISPSNQPTHHQRTEPRSLSLNGYPQASKVMSPRCQPADPSDVLGELLPTELTHTESRNGSRIDWLTRAEQYVAHRQWSQAIAAAQQAVKLTPNAHAYKLLGNAWQALGEGVKAQQAYGQALRLQTHFPEVYANLGSLYAQQQQWPRAIAAYRQALQQHPKFAGAYRNLAKIFTQVGRTAAALECQYRAFYLEPQQWDVGTVLNLGNALLEQGKLDGAIRCYQHVIQLQPDLAGVYQNLAEAYRRKGDLKAAIGYSKKAVALLAQQTVTEPDRPTIAALPPTPVKTATTQLSKSTTTGVAQQAVAVATRGRAPEEILQLLAEAYCQRQDWGKAIPACYEALQLCPDALTYKHLGNALQATGQIGEAEKAYREAVRLNPQFVEGYANLGSLFAQQQRWSEAIAAFRQALTINPQFAGGYRNLARLWERRGDEERALACWQRALAIEPASLSAVDYVTLGNRWVKLNKLSEAGRCYQQAINFDPSLVGAWYNLAEILSMQGRWDGAILAYRRAIALKSDLPGIELKLARTYRARSRADLDLAAAWYAKAIEVDATQVESCGTFLNHSLQDVQPYLQLGSALVAHDRIAEAVTLYQDVLGAITTTRLSS